MNKQVLDVVDAVSYEMEVDKNIIFEAIESALEVVTKKRCLNNMEIEVRINRNTGNYTTNRCWKVVDNDFAEFDEEKHITIKEASKEKGHNNPKINDVIKREIESIKFGRIAAQTAKQKILTMVYLAQQKKLVQSYKKKINSIISGTVKKTSKDGVVLEVEKNVEVLIPKNNILPGESVHIGDRMRAHLCEISTEAHTPKMIASRTSKKMLLELLKIEVPEIGEETIEVKGIARDPGLRSKIAVKTNDGRIDPIGACIGMRGSRIQAISNELNGERIDIILWNENTAQLVINAMAPAEIASLLVDEDKNSIDIAVEKEQLPQAIGRNGQNVRLASELTGWALNIMSSEDFKNKKEEESNKIHDSFMNNLHVNAKVASVLLNNGFISIEEIAYVPMNELLEIKGLTKNMVNKLRKAAGNFMSSEADTSITRDLLTLEGMTKELACLLTSNGILTKDDLAELSIDDLLDITNEIDRSSAGKLIMKARKHWFK